MDRIKEILVQNIFDFDNSSNEFEVFDKLLEKNELVIERIISTGQKSPDDFWYDQEKDEWVLLLSGSAKLKFIEGENSTLIELKKGDYLFIPAHLKHRVEATSTTEATIWLAIFV